MGQILKRFSAKNWWLSGLIIVLTFIQVFFTMQIVKYLGLIFNAIANVKANGVAEIWWYGLYMVISALLFAAAQVGVEISSSKNASDVATKLRNDLYAKVNDFSISDMAMFSTESLITRATNDIQNVHLAIITAFRTIFLAPITMIWSIVLIIQMQNKGLTLLTVGWLLLVIIVVVVLIIILIPKFKIIQKITDQLNVSAKENLTGVRVVRAFNAEEYQENKFTYINKDYTRAQIFNGKAIAFFTPFITFVMFGLSLSIIWLSAYFINGLNLEEANIAFAATNSFVMLGNQIILSFVLLLSFIILIPRANVCMSRIMEVLNHEETIKDPEEPLDFTEHGTIEFKRVGFAYPGSEVLAVSDISFKVRRGQTIAFIGATGSGKTTIVNLIPRLTDVTRGEVLVNGVNVKDVKQKDLREKIGYTPQKVTLFKGNIKDNIAFSNPKMTVKDIIIASKIAMADEFISKKEMAYDSEVAQGGTNFSGGQKQRISIARSIAKKPEIIIFDDSFSALDYKTDKLVRNNLSKYLPYSTKVIVAQRVGTIMDADIIVVLEKGKMVGIGSHNELLEKCEVYKEIALSQLSKEELGL